MICVNENKAQIVKGDFHPAKLYKGDKKIAGYKKETFEGEGTVTLENCYNDKLHNACIFGNSLQESVPSPEEPVEIKSVGDLVTEGEHKGKYKISIIAKNTENLFDKNKEPRIFDIYLDEPLCKIGSYEDYIDFENKKVVRNTSSMAFTGAEIWTATRFRVYTTVSKMNEISSDEVNCLCNRFQAYSYSKLYENLYLGAGRFNIAAAMQGYNFSVTPAQEIPTIDEWKAQLSLWNDEGTPLTVIYADTVREEELSLPELPTFRGTTIYEISTEISAKISGAYKRVE